MKELPNPTMPLSMLDLPRGSLHRHDHQTQKNVVPTPSTQNRSGLIVEWAKHLD